MSRDRPCLVAAAPVLHALGAPARAEGGARPPLAQAEGAAVGAVGVGAAERPALGALRAPEASALDALLAAGRVPVPPAAPGYVPATVQAVVVPVTPVAILRPRAHARREDERQQHGQRTERPHECTHFKPHPSCLLRP